MCTHKLGRVWSSRQHSGNNWVASQWDQSCTCLHRVMLGKAHARQQKLNFKDKLFCMYERFVPHRRENWVHVCGERKRVLTPHIRKTKNQCYMLFLTIIPSGCRSVPNMVGACWCWLNHVWKQTFGPERDRCPGSSSALIYMSGEATVMFPQVREHAPSSTVCACTWRTRMPSSQKDKEEKSTLTTGIFLLPSAFQMWRRNRLALHDPT